MDTEAPVRLHAGSPGLTFEDYAAVAPEIVRLSGQPWYRYGRILRPLAMPHEPVQVDSAELRAALAETGSLLACWTDQWDSGCESQWWWTICDKRFGGPEEIESSRGRRYVRKGLRECEVRRMAPDEYLELTYPLFAKALVGYGEAAPDRGSYELHVQGAAAWRGSEFWGAFHENRLAAYAACTVVGDAVSVASTKSDSDLGSHQPNAAIFHTLTQDYLDRGFKYVTNGWRTMLHPTGINEYLERLGYRKAYGRVNIELSPIAKVIDTSAMVRWGRFVGLKALLGGRWSEMEGFQILVDIARSFR